MKYWAECNNCGVQKVHLTYEQVKEFQETHAYCRRKIKQKSEDEEEDEDEEEELYN
jgi:hypothetical protein